MSDPIFTPFEPAASEKTEPETAPPRKGRGKSKPKDTKPAPAQATGETPVKPAKTRKPRKKKEAFMVDLALAGAVLSGLSEDESGMVLRAAQILAAMPVESRQRIVDALGKLFA